MQQLNVVSFDDHLKAAEFQLAAMRLASQSQLALEDVVFVAKTPDGNKVRVHETTDRTVGVAAASGGFWGLLFGTLLLGPFGLVAGAATAGGSALAAKLIDTGVTDEFIQDIKEAVAPGHTAVILLTSGGDIDALARELERFSGARLIHSNLSPEARDAVEEALAEGAALEHVEVIRSSAPTKT